MLTYVICLMFVKSYFLHHNWKATTQPLDPVIVVQIHHPHRHPVRLP